MMAGFMMIQGAQQTPIPCMRCGGPMKEDGPATLVGPVHVRCPYCNAVETLPEQQAQRVTALRARLASLRGAQLAEEGPALAYATFVQTLRSQIWTYVGILGLVIFGTLYSANESIQRAIASTSIPAATRAELLSSATTYPAASIGLFLGGAVGYILALANYKRKIVPTLRARAPMQPGQPARCRACGASLPADPTKGAMVPCSYCAAQNLISDDLVRDRARLLDEEARAYSARAAGVQEKTTKAIVAMSTYFYIGAGVGVLLALAIGLAARYSIAALFF